MTAAPREDYSPETTKLMVSGCLHLASVLGDFYDDIVLIGGLVPFLLVDQENRPYEDQHVGSRDVDIALNVDLLEAERYEAIAKRLRSAGFDYDLNDKGNPTHQRWIYTKNNKVMVEFFIDSKGTPGTIQKMSDGLGAIRTPGSSLAFYDFEVKELRGTTLDNAVAERKLRVCGPGAFVLLKASALRIRGNGKDALDIVYIAQNYEGGLAAIANCIRKLLIYPSAKEYLTILHDDFQTPDHIGPRRLAEWSGNSGDENLRADASGIVWILLTFAVRPSCSRTLSLEVLHRDLLNNQL